MVGPILPGNDCILEWKTFNSSGQPDDPTAVYFQFKGPHDSIYTTWVLGANPGVWRAGVGDFKAQLPYTYPASKSENWSVRFIGTGNLNLAAEDTVQILYSPFGAPS